MAADFTLLGGANLPQRVQPLTPADAVGNTATAYTLAGKMTDVNEKVRKAKEAEQDRQIMQDAMRSGQYDFSTSEGLDKAVSGLQGKLSPSAFASLQSHADETKKAYIGYLKAARESSAADRALGLAQETEMAGMFHSLFQTYDTVAQQKGTQDADAAFDQGKSALIQQLAQQKTPGGDPMYSPEAIQNISSMPKEQLRAFAETSPMRMAALKAADVEAQANQRNAQAKLYAGGGTGNWSTYVAGQDKYSHNAKSNQWLKNGEPIDVSQVPGDIAKAGTRDAIQTAAGSAELTDDAKQFLADYSLNNGKSFPMPTFGMGPVAAKLKTEYVNRIAQLAKERGFDGSDVALRALQRDASKESLKRLTTQEAAINAGSRDAEMVLDRIVQEVKALGGPDSPKVRQIWNTAMTDWVGSPEFTRLNMAIINFQEVAARVLSNQSGAGSTPVAFLHLAERLQSPGINLEQALASREQFKELANFRRKSVDAEKHFLLDSMKAPGSASSGERISKEDQSGRDNDAVKILKDEYDKAVSSLKGLTGADRTRKLEDIGALRREIVSKGGKDPGSPTASQESSTGAPKEGDKGTSKSGKSIIYRNGRWEYE